MRRFLIVLSVCLTIGFGLWLQPKSALAASSGAIRAFDDVQITGKSAAKNFAGQNLQQSEFGDAKLIEANFKGADLRGAVFNGAVLTHANLQGVDFSDGIAYITDFGQADLSNAILNSAMMLKSSFKGATVTGADFSDALLDYEQVAHLCQSAAGVNPVTKVNTRESLGCK
jgi:uncharacterized protein YjbI with pentapeptide repeats